MWKKLVLVIAVFVISFGLVGCTITDADILARAALATWQLSNDGYTYLGYMHYAGNYWYFSMNIITNSFMFGSWSEAEFWQRVVQLAPIGHIIEWAAVPAVVRVTLVEVVRESVPLVSVWSNFFIILPVCFDANCNPPLMPTPQPM